MTGDERPTVERPGSAFTVVGNPQLPGSVEFQAVEIAQIANGLKCPLEGCRTIGNQVLRLVVEQREGVVVTATAQIGEEQDFGPIGSDQNRAQVAIPRVCDV